MIDFASLFDLQTRSRQNARRVLRSLAVHRLARSEADRAVAAAADEKATGLYRAASPRSFTLDGTGHAGP